MRYALCFPVRSLFYSSADNHYNSPVVAVFVLELSG